MAKGEVPIAYIIALILGIAVVAVLGYWFFVLQGQGGGEINLDQCRNKAFTYCSMYRDNGYTQNADTKVPSLGFIGGEKWFSKTSKDGVVGYAPACSTFGVLTDKDATTLATECEALLG